jgi:hypothetical protein
MEGSTKALFIKENSMVMVCSNGKTGQVTKENGSTKKNMVRVRE